MVSHKIGAILGAVAGLAPAAATAGLDTRQTVEVDPANFRRRAFQSLAVLGDYLYIDGGELSNWIDGNLTEEQESFGFRNSWSISLTESWTNATVIHNTIDREDPGEVITTTLWADTDETRIYRYGGAVPFGAAAESDANTLYYMTPDGEGDADWVEAQDDDVENPDVFDDFAHTTGAASTVCNQVGYRLGGFGSSSTDEQFDDSVPVPGMVSYDFSTGAWANDSVATLNEEDGRLVGASAVCIPEFQSDPLVLSLGGSMPGPNALDDAAQASMANVTFFNTATRQLHWQETTGDIPEARSSFCAVGAQAGQDGTYEVSSIIYGGDHPQDGVLDDMFVLTIPGFRWFRIDAPAPARRFHACASLGSRLMISAGGTDENDYEDPDVWPYGIGVFDMTALEWVDEFDPEARDYQTPAVVQDWYDGGGLDTVEWSSGEVHALFMEDADPDADNPEEDPDSGNGDSSDSGSGNDSSSDDSETNVGAIAGGVVGGIAALALLGLAIFFYRRRRGNASVAEHIELHGDGTDHVDHKRSYPPSAVSPVTIGQYTPSHGPPGNGPSPVHAPVEAPSEPSQRHEMAG